MGLFDKIIDNIKFDNFVNSATHEELSEAYEKERQGWVKNGFNGEGSKTDKMKKLDNAISKKVAEEWENDPRRNKNPNFRWTDANRWDKD